MCVCVLGRCEFAKEPVPIMSIGSWQKLCRASGRSLIKKEISRDKVTLMASDGLS